MKITIKTIKGDSHQLDVNATDKVSELKVQVQQKLSVEPENQKLIYKGKHLENEKTLSDFGIADGDTVIVMVLKKYTPAPEPAPAPAQTPAPKPATAAPPAPAFGIPAQPPRPAQPAQPATPAQPPAQLDPNNEIVYGSQHKVELIKELSDMGFAADQVEKALVAAFFNKDRAVDYLLNGIPANMLPQHPPAHAPAPGQTPAHGVPAPGQAPAQGVAPGQPGPAPGQPGQIAVTPQQMAQIQQLVTSPEFENIRQQALQNPQVVTQLMLFLQQNRPELFQLFQQNPGLLVALITGQFQQMDAGGEEGEELEAEEAQLTPEDMAVIQNLRNFGFTEQQCVEAYLLCDKNQELAINYLLDQQANAPANPAPLPPQNPPKPPHS